MRGQELNDLPRCELERQSSHHKGIFFEVPNGYKHGDSFIALWDPSVKGSRQQWLLGCGEC
jgi:hypothetical protein